MRLAKRNAIREERLRASLATHILEAQAQAAANVRDWVKGEGDADTPFSDVTLKHKASLLLAQGTMQAERAKQDQGQRGVMGVLIIDARRPDTIENRKEWEAEVRELSALPARGSSGP